MSNWQRVQEAFGDLETVAGLGASDDLNEWDSSYEGGSALLAELSRPHMAMADAEGNIYIADKEAHAIRKVSGAGIITTVAGTNQSGDAPDQPTVATDGPLSNPNGLWVLPDATLFILDLGNGKVRKVDEAGVMTTLFSASSLSVGRGLWVRDDEAEAFVCSGSSLLQWTESAGVVDFAGGFVELGMVLRGPDGRIWVGDRGGHQVWSLSDSGERRHEAGDPSTTRYVDSSSAQEAALNEPRALWPYAGGWFIGTHAGSQVVFMDDQGITHLFLDGAPNAHAGDGERFDTPGAKVSEVRSLTMNTTGDLIIVESDEGYVRVVKAR